MERGESLGGADGSPVSLSLVPSLHERPALHYTDMEQKSSLPSGDE